MFKMIASILTQQSGLPFASSRPSVWFGLKVKLGCIFDLLKARFGVGITG